LWFVVRGWWFVVGGSWFVVRGSFLLQPNESRGVAPTRVWPGLLRGSFAATGLFCIYRALLSVCISVAGSGCRCGVSARAATGLFCFYRALLHLQGSFERVY